MAQALVVAVSGSVALLADTVHNFLPEARAAQLLVEEDRPEALILNLLLQFAHIGFHRRIGYAHRMREHVVERLDLLLTELLDPVELLLEIRFSAEIPSHASLLDLSAVVRAIR